MALRERLAALLGVSTYEKAPPYAGPSLGDRQVEDVRATYGGQIAPLPFTNVRWYLRDLESALHLADAGDLSMAAEIMRAARTDPIFSGVLSATVGGILKLPRKFRGNPEMASALDIGHESVRSVFDEMFPPAEMQAMIEDGLLLGISVAELRPVEGRDFPVLVRLDPAYLRFRWNMNRWFYSSIAGLLPITPGDGRWVLHVPGGRVSPWQFGKWRAVGRAWIPKEHANNYWDNWIAKLANAARAAVSPAGASESQRQSWFQSVMAWGVNQVFGMPPGYDVRLIESNGRGWEGFNEKIIQSNRDLMIAICGQVGTTEGGVGFSNKDLFLNVQGDIIETIAKSAAYTLNTQGIPPWIVGRWGESGLDHPVIVEFDYARPKDRTAAAQSLSQAAGAMKALREELANHATVDSSGNAQPMALDSAQFAQEFGIPIAGDLDADGKPEPSAATPAPAPAKPDGSSDDDQDDAAQLAASSSAAAPRRRRRRKAAA